MANVKKSDIIPKNGKFQHLDAVSDVIPSVVFDEIASLIRREPEGEKAVREIRLRADARSSLSLASGVRYLGTVLSYKDISDTVARLTGGSLYAHRDTVADGFVTLSGGIRVGIAGRARYEGGSLVGIFEVRSLVFRIPHSVCDVEEELFALWRRGVGSGLLIYSPPGGGKTTAVRRLSARIGESGVRVCVVDERCEFVPEDYRLSEVELLRGYSKSRGIEIAVRTLGAEVIVVDEIGASEARGLALPLMLGVPIIATAHAASRAELLTRPAFSELLSHGIFETCAGLVTRGGRRAFESFRIGGSRAVSTPSWEGVLN